MSNIELYEFPISGNCHKVRMLLSFLKLQYRSRIVNGAAGEQKSPQFLAMNPFGQVPLLVEDGLAVRDSQAILVYLAMKYSRGVWLAEDPAGVAQTAAWLSTAANEITRGPAAMRAHYKFGRALDLEAAEKMAASVCSVVDGQLSKAEWLVGAAPTIADLAVYPYLALAHEGKFDLSPYPAILAWMRRIRAMPGFVSMPGIEA
ncbi:MAG: glutathione S-transferase [Leptospirales bacterium]|nr:glutathione S-transferase [Leptospirales bacterium]